MVSRKMFRELRVKSSRKVNVISAKLFYFIVINFLKSKRCKVSSCECRLHIITGNVRSQPILPGYRQSANQQDAILTLTSTD
jgi:hypothetical protein